MPVLFNYLTLIIVIVVMTMTGCTFATGTSGGMTLSNKPLSLSQMFGQKLMLDFRYYCEQQDVSSSRQCRTPLTTLPDEIAELITALNIGGVIMFSENLETIPQIVTLNDRLQQAGMKSASGLPLFIAIDQEGGRVARLPRSVATSFSGNMAIGATSATHGLKYATLTGEIIGKELYAAGFNVNFAPTVDVNVNALNPVINVRSFSENPAQVAELGFAQMTAMQKNGVIGTLKHFPGHGDTSVDSHTGLPVVNHQVEEIKTVDLAPFKYAIDTGQVSMIMTAHIQYPELDSSTFVSKTGKVMVKPATMSKAILTDLLRMDMGYSGVVITDALDMHGISEFFTESEAVIETFNAGADIALMPIKINTKSDISKLKGLIADLVAAVHQGTLNKSDVVASYQRIAELKSKHIPDTVAESVQQKSLAAAQLIGHQNHRTVEQALSDDSITLVKGTGTLPHAVKKVQIFMPDKSKCMAIQHAFLSEQRDLDVTCDPYYALTAAQIKQKIHNADAIIATNVTPTQSLAEMGGMDDLAALKRDVGNLAKNKRDQDAKLLSILKLADAQHKHVTFVSLRMPYEMSRYGQYADNLIATYAYNQYDDAVTNSPVGPAYLSLVKVLSGKLKAKGRLPVSIDGLGL